jgi:hypothetical protein
VQVLLFLQSIYCLELVQVPQAWDLTIGGDNPRGDEGSANGRNEGTPGGVEYGQTGRINIYLRDQFPASFVELALVKLAVVVVFSWLGVSSLTQYCRFFCRPLSAARDDKC